MGSVDFVARFRDEAARFEAAVRRAADAPEAPPVPSCPGWTVSDLVLHLGQVHRVVTAILRTRLVDPPEGEDPEFGLPGERPGWPAPRGGPTPGPVPASLVEWYAAGAEELGGTFAATDPALHVWTWSPEQTAGFWMRMQAIEAAVHRWDAEAAVGDPAPPDRMLACDAMAQTFEVMAPARRRFRPAPPGAGETYRFRATDTGQSWSVRFSGDEVEFPAHERGGPPTAKGLSVELSGTAADLMMFTWGRVPLDRLAVAGDHRIAERLPVLIPPV
ncbi:maleylpyruvate isomerase family mycothiol-dependent enzyme [Yinghuangia soli]|uniref:Maleylpyruvate isomerase family mycothiol-dependent enzyme n=1 Tax=Yinghuangia soli TaxID=2908204 RepID=A0AA41U2J0_9ACTN|nr:maleylpyruvate isomerase family mycothiol-dependent enzyme [Yinghuangia soli]MCF2528692.1 maleylpyruvate isomerase family mycothiol-dependent enzyme [Yinghuangia soli]